MINYISLLKGWEIQPRVLKAEVKKTNELMINFNTGINDLSGTYSGFIVKVNNKSLHIKNIHKDYPDSAKLHIILEETINSGQKVTLSYQQGQLTGIGDVFLKPFKEFNVENKITETTIKNE